MSNIQIDHIASLVLNIETLNVNADADPRVIAMLETLIAGQSAEVTRDAAERVRDMTFAQDVGTLLGQVNQRLNEIKTDQADLIARLAAAPTDEERADIISQLTAANDELGTIASGYTPVPVTPGEVPGETPLPDVPTDGGGDGSGAGGTGDGGGVPA